MGIKYIFRRKNVLEIFKIYIFNVCNLFWCHQQIPLFHSSGHYTIHDCHYKTLKSSITSHHVQIHVILLSEPGESAWRLFAWFSLISNIRQWQIIMTSSVDEYCFLKHWWHWYGKCTRVALGSAKGRACPEGNNILHRWLSQCGSFMLSFIVLHFILTEQVESLHLHMLSFATWYRRCQQKFL